MTASIAVILFAAAITPGPNNIVVMDVARRSLFAVGAPIAGIILGTLLLILGLRFGFDVVLATHPKADPAMRVAGACVLGYLAIRALIGGWSKASTRAEKTPPQRALFWAMVSFQIINPKTWVLASAVSATHAAHNEASILSLVLLAIFVPAACLMVWATIGAVLGRFFQKPAMQKGVSALFAIAFLMFAAALILSG